MAAENFLIKENEDDICDICYDNECEIQSLITLKCCNDSKKICIKCVNCLKTPICPYCRKPLDSSCVPFMNEEALISRSEPATNNNTSYLTWDNFLSQENIIDPSLYDDSRRMRRMMRRLRYQYRQVNTNNSIITHTISRDQRRNFHRRQRQQNRNISRQAMNLHNISNENIDEIFFME